jgi:3D (Asp-Asp-Asp) domain-containing protein
MIVTLLMVEFAPKVEEQEETVQETVETEEVQTEPVILIAAEENDQVEEPDDEIDLAKLKQIENATVTAYCCCKRCCGKDESHPAYGITASGRPAEPFVSVAVDPFLIPLGSTVYLDYGDGELLEFRADDTGSGVAGAHIDVCYPDHWSALEHGVKEARVWWKEE